MTHETQAALAWFWSYHIKHRLTMRIDAVALWIAWHLPRRIVTWCYIRVGAYATTGEWSDTVVPEISMMDALKRWTDQ